MAKIRIELNSEGIRQMLKGAEVEQAVGDVAKQIADRAGTGYGSDTKQMPGRVVASAFTETKEAMQDNMENNTLLKAMGGGHE